MLIMFWWPLAIKTKLEENIGLFKLSILLLTEMAKTTSVPSVPHSPVWHQTPLLKLDI